MENLVLTLQLGTSNPTLLAPAKAEPQTSAKMGEKTGNLSNGTNHLFESTAPAHTVEVDSEQQAHTGDNFPNGADTIAANSTQEMDSNQHSPAVSAKADAEGVNGLNDAAAPNSELNYAVAAAENAVADGTSNSDEPIKEEVTDGPESKKRGFSESHDGSKKKQQSVLKFFNTEVQISAKSEKESANGDAMAVDKVKPEENQENESPHAPEFLVTFNYKKAAELKLKRARNKARAAAPEKVRNFDRAAKKPLPKEEPFHLPLVRVQKKASRSKQPCTTTTILRENNRNARPLPGPLVPLHSDLYDGNVINSENNKAVAAEKLAFGFPVKHNPNLYDIMYILLFLAKFEPVVQAGPLGPEDFEIGLDLATEGRPQISQTMEVFFRRLLVLLLNRKKPIPKDGQRPAIQELQTKYVSFGLPEEWRDDSMVHQVDSFPCNPEDDVVDPSKPPVAPEDLIEYEGSKELPNPSHSKDFEDFGLAGIDSPRQRVILLRTMVVWCLSVSLRVKTFLTSVVGKQEVPGERDNIYVSRAVLKGFAHTAESKKDHEIKVARKIKPNNKGAMQDFDLRLAYMDPTSNPMTHPLALRLNEYVIGDIGFHVGRFYLVRTADASAGGLGSLEDMKKAAKISPADRSMATNFRLYVEDVYSLLELCLRVDGIEFDADGKEVVHNVNYDDTKYWYTVASNFEELRAFHDHIELKLASSRSSLGTVSSSSDAYRPLLHMCQWLRHVVPIIGELEGTYVSGSGEHRAARKKFVDYSVGLVWEEEAEEYQENTGDYNYSDEDEQGFDEDEDGEEEGAFLE